jgi:hypothetical protein
MIGKIEILASPMAASLGLLLLAAPAVAQTMPACDAPETVAYIAKMYKFSDDNKGGTFQSLKGDIKEMGNVPTIENYHMYETETQKIDGVRFCQVTAVLGGGQTDTVYYRIVHLVDGAKHKFNPDFCSPRLFTFFGQCEDWRPK